MSAADNRPLLVLGSANTDMVVHTEKLPEPGQTVLGSPLRIFGGGKGANQAVAAARGGATVHFAGCVGDDDFGRRTRRELEADGIDCTLLRTVPRVASGVALIVVDEQGENQITVSPGANHSIVSSDLEAIDFARFSWLVMQLEIPRQIVFAAARHAHEAGCRILLNPAPAAELPAELLQALEILVVNRGELELLDQLKEADDALLLATGEAIRRRGPRHVILTLGGEGSIWFHEDGHERFPALPVSPVDCVGAGDCFVGNLAAAMVRGDSVCEAIRFATAAAAFAVQQHGARVAMPSRSQTLDLLGRSHEEAEHTD